MPVDSGWVFRSLREIITHEWDFSNFSIQVVIKLSSLSPFLKRPKRVSWRLANMSFPNIYSIRGKGCSCLQGILLLLDIKRPNSTVTRSLQSHHRIWKLSLPSPKIVIPKHRKYRDIMNGKYTKATKHRPPSDMERSFRPVQRAQLPSPSEQNSRSPPCYA